MLDVQNIYFVIFFYFSPSKDMYCSDLKYNSEVPLVLVDQGDGCTQMRYCWVVGWLVVWISSKMSNTRRCERAHKTLNGDRIGGNTPCDKVGWMLRKTWPSSGRYRGGCSNEEVRGGAGTSRGRPAQPPASATILQHQSHHTMERQTDNCQSPITPIPAHLYPWPTWL